MKYLVCLSLLISSMAWSKSVKNFNQAITDDFQKEIKKDEDKFKKPVMRGPASVAPSPASAIKEPSKIDKNIRQIGPSNW
jgi:hypothetical protein